mgnify:CR=1 FL=1
MRVKRDGRWQMHVVERGVIAGVRTLLAEGKGLPLAVATFGTVRMPAAGGGYLRQFPLSLMQRALVAAGSVRFGLVETVRLRQPRAVVDLGGRRQRAVLAARSASLARAAISRRHQSRRSVTSSITG